MTAASIVWRRLDRPGTDACRLEPAGAGWQLDGTATFFDSDVAARLDYRVTCDASWRTQHGEVQGWIGSRSIALTIARTNVGDWTLNNSIVRGLAECVDLDLGFTPATNLLSLRRLTLAEGESADVPAAWLDPSGGTLEILRQRYTRRGEHAYWYEAPRFAYAALLEVTAAGFICRYPGLWEAEL
jgi:hypothetical protein